MLKVSECADEARVTPTTVRRWIRNGTLLAVKMGGVYRIKKADWSSFLNGGYHGTGSSEKGSGVEGKAD